MDAVGDADDGHFVFGDALPDILPEPLADPPVEG